MFYVSAVDIPNNTVTVTDTKDKTSDCFIREDLLDLVNRYRDIEVKGVHVGKSLIYPVDCVNNKFYYRGHCIGEPIFDAFMWDGIATVNKLKKHKGYPINPKCKISTTSCLRVSILEGNTIKSYLATILEFLDDNWYSRIRKARIKLYSTTGVREEIRTVALTTHDFDFAVRLRALAYLSFDKIIADLGTNPIEDCISEFLSKYSDADLENILTLTEKTFSDDNRQICLNTTRSVPVDTVFNDLYLLVRGIYDTEVGKKHYYPKYFEIKNSYFDDKMHFPIFDILDRLLFSPKESAGAYAVGLFDKNDAYHGMYWEGSISIKYEHLKSTDADAPPNSWQVDTYSDVVMSYAGDVLGCADCIKIVGLPDYYKNSSLLIEDVDADYKSDGIYQTPRGMYFFKISEYLAFATHDDPTPADMKLSMRSKITTGAVTHITNDGVLTSLVCGNNKILTIPQGCKEIAKGSLIVTSDTAGLVVPSSCVKFDESAYKTEGFMGTTGWAIVWGHPFVINIDVKDETVIHNVISIAFQQYMYTAKMVYRSRLARVELAKVLLYIKHNYRYFEYTDGHEKGVYSFLSTLGNTEAEAVVNYLWTKDLQTLYEQADTIELEFRDVAIHQKADELCCFWTIKMSKGVSYRIRDVYFLIKTCQQHINNLPDVLKGYCLRVYKIYTTLQKRMIGTIKGAGYRPDKKGYLHITKVQVTELNGSDYSEDYNIGW